MKTRVKILALVLFIFSCMTFMAATPTDMNNNTEDKSGIIVDKGVNFTADQIEFSNTTNDQLDKLFLSWNGEYPDYYGGSYMDAANMKVYLLVTCNPETVCEEIWRITGNPNIMIKQVNYSYNQLAKTRDEITTKISDITNAGDDRGIFFVGCGVDEMKNRVFVEILDGSNLSEKDVYSIIGNEDKVDIVIKSEEYTETYDINAGARHFVYNTTAGGASTISCCGRVVAPGGGYVYGFAIAGHAGDLYDQMNLNYRTVGYVQSRSFGGQLDMSFVDITGTSFNRTKELSNSYTIDGYNSVGIVGTIYTCHGMTSGIIGGVVNNTSFSFTMNGVNFDNFIRMQMTIAAGDSGAPLVKQNSGYSRNVVGFLSGGDSSYANFSKFTVFAAAFGFTLYS